MSVLKAWMQWKLNSFNQELSPQESGYLATIQGLMKKIEMLTAKIDVLETRLEKHAKKKKRSGVLVNRVDN